MTRFRIAPMDRTDLIVVDQSANPLAPMKQLFCLDTETRKVWITGRHQCENGVPMRVWHGIVKEWEIPITADAQALCEAINAGELDDLLTRITDGASIIWDGNNHAGRLTEDAVRAVYEVQDWFDEWTNTLPDSGGLWDAGDWFADYPPEEVTATSTDEELEALAERLEEEAKDVGAILAYTREYLSDLRGRLRTRVEADPEYNAEEWWDAARASADAPAAVQPLLDGAEHIFVLPAEAEAIREWAAQLPGWDNGPEYAGTALLFHENEEPWE